jgi:hypothetical protein
VEPTIPTVAELIRDHGIRVNTKPCTQCDRWSLYRIPDPDNEIAFGFMACVVCDTNTESRKQANLQARR